MTQVYSVLMPGLGEYTGTYKGSVEIERERVADSVSAAVQVTTGKMLAEAASRIEELSIGGDPESGLTGLPPERYVFGRITPQKGTSFDIIGMGAEPYPVRIERMGSPVYDWGKGAWEGAAEAGEKQLAIMLEEMGL